MYDRLKRLESVGIPLDLLADLLDTTEFALRNWMAGAMSVEEADIVEVGLSMLEVRLARVIAQRHEVTQPMTAVA